MTKGNDGGSTQSCAEMKNSPYDDKIVSVHDKIRDHNRIPVVHRDLLAGIVLETPLFMVELPLSCSPSLFLVVFEG